MGNAEMAKKTGAKIIIHEEDATALVRTPSDLLEMFGATASPPADIVVKEGDVIQVGHVKLTVIHTPGHSAGGISLYLDGMVFTGTPSLWARWEGPISRGAHGMSWNRLFGKSSMSCPEKQWSSPVTTMDPRPPRPSSTRDDTTLLSEGKGSIPVVPPMHLQLGGFFATVSSTGNFEFEPRNPKQSQMDQI